MEAYNFAAFFSSTGVPVPGWAINQKFNRGSAGNATEYDDMGLGDLEFGSEVWDDDDSDEFTDLNRTSVVVSSSLSTPSSASATATWSPLFTFSPITPLSGFTLSIKSPTASPGVSPTFKTPESPAPTMDITLHSHKSEVSVKTTSWDDCDTRVCNERGRSNEECTSAKKRCSLYSTFDWDTVESAPPGILTQAPNDCGKWDGVDCSTLDAQNLMVCQTDQRYCLATTSTPATPTSAHHNECLDFDGIDCSYIEDANLSAACIMNHKNCLATANNPKPTH